MNQLHVLVVGNTSLMGAAIENILLHDTTLNVRGYVPEDKQALIRKIWQSRPDTIIVDEQSLYFKPARLLDELDAYPNLRIVVVSANNNTMRVFEKKALTTSPFINLTAVVRGNQMEMVYSDSKNLEFVSS